MSKKSEITVAERQILDFIKFRSNERHRFFGSNEYIGNSIGLQTSSVTPIILYLSPDVTNPKLTNKVLTIMLAQEY